MKKNKKLITFLVLFVFGVVYSLYGWARTMLPFSQFVIYIIFFFLNIILIGSYGYAVFRSNDRKSPAQLKKRMIPLFLFFILGAFVICLIICGSFFSIARMNEGVTLSDIIKETLSVDFFLGIFGNFSKWIMIVSIFLLYMLWKDAINREQQLHEENLKYKYRTLKTQVNPHFLFNSLNTLSEIVYVDAKKADNYIQKLSGIYRYILDNEDTDLISLDKEIDFVRKYFDLQKERDDNKIRLDIDIESLEKFKIVPISLQILIENALKHNAMSEDNPLKIRIYKENSYVVVSNDIQRKSTLNNPSIGTGLANLKERVKLITGEEVFINRENNLFVVKLPIIIAEK